MKNELILFSFEQGNLLIRLLLAHVISDFVFQTNKMVLCKKWFSAYMFLHIAIVFLSTFLLSGLWKVSLIIALVHWLIDSIKVTLQNQAKLKPIILFIGDQVFHFVVITAVWIFYCDLYKILPKIISFPFVSYNWSLTIFAYIIVFYPVGYFVKFATQSIDHISNPSPQSNVPTEAKIEHGGKLIGQFERIIILTLVLLKQYEAIGFLITGKSIIRFADHNSNLRSEYVLVGTMMSYAIAILTGVSVNYLLSLK